MIIMKNKFSEILIEIDDIIAKIGDYKLSDTQRSELIKAFNGKIKQAKIINKKVNRNLAS